MSDDEPTCSRACPKVADPALHHHACPSGEHYNIRIPDLPQWRRYGYVPDPLSAIVAKAVHPEFKFDDLSAEEQEQFDDLQDWVVSEVVEPHILIERVKGWCEVGDKWEPVPDAIPREDRDDIWLVARRLDMPSPIDYALRKAYGPAAGTILEHLPFRDGAERVVVPANRASTGKGPRQPRRNH